MLSEAEIIQGCRKNDSTAQRLLHNLYAKKMYSVCCRYITDKEAAKDVLQDGFIKVFQHINTYNEEGPVGAWIRRIMVNTALSLLRKNKKQLFQSLQDEKEESTKAIHAFQEDETEEDGFLPQYAFSQQELLQLIDALPEQLKLIFNLFAIEQYSHKEIAVLLSINEGTSRIRLMRARKELQEKIMNKSTSQKLVY